MAKGFTYDFTHNGFNRYAYCSHNPLRYVDPTGWTQQYACNPNKAPSLNPTGHTTFIWTIFPKHYVYHTESQTLYYYTPFEGQSSIYIRSINSHKDLYRNLGF